MEAERLVFIDESGFWVGMNRPVARAKKGMKAYETQKPYCDKKMTVISAIRRSGVVTIKGLKGSMKKEDFLEFVKVNLAPQLKVGDVVIMDKLELIYKSIIKHLEQPIFSPSNALSSHRSSLHSSPNTTHSPCSIAEIGSASQTSARQ
ncbi:hypothetical protein BCR12_18870 [Limnothrix sp. P13C2]|nr:hypothetical protein BCR12_18870 [Limnothrix sp. P13C2]